MHTPLAEPSQVSRDAFAAGPLSTTTATQDSAWWAALWPALRQLPPEAQGPWMTWLAQPTTGPEGLAWTWETFEQGALALSQLRDVAGTVDALSQWIAWHGSGRVSVREAARWPSTPHVHVWEGGPEARRASVVANIATALCLSPHGLAEADVRPVRVVLGNIPLADLGLAPDTSFANLVGILGAPLRHSEESVTGRAWASSDELCAQGVGGWLNRWLTPYTREYPNNEARPNRLTIQQQTYAQLLLEGLCLRTDWSAEALEALFEILGTQAVERLTIQDRVPIRLVTAVADHVASILATRQLQPNGHLKSLARALHHVPGGSSPDRDARPPQKTQALQPEETDRVNHAIRVGLMADHSLIEYSRAKGSFAQVGVDLEQGPFYRELERLLGDPHLVASWDREMVRRVLGHPRKAIRERLLSTLATLRPGGNHPAEAKDPAPPPPSTTGRKLPS